MSFTKRLKKKKENYLIQLLINDTYTVKIFNTGIL